MVEKEPFQLEYERYAINRSLKKIGKRYGLKSVLEVPAAGLKAMPSLYSLGFGEAGCEVILVNPEERGIKIWRDLKLNAREVRADDLAHLPLEENSVDLVWNFNTLSLYKNYEEILKELIRVSRKYVMILCVNGYNVGSPIHRGLHRMMKVAWTHGEKLFLLPKNVKRLLEKANLGVVEVGGMNCPPWPDTVGFRDMKFHRSEEHTSEL